jgi:hypothetical protein
VPLDPPEPCDVEPAALDTDEAPAAPLAEPPSPVPDAAPCPAAPTDEWADDPSEPDPLVSRLPQSIAASSHPRMTTLVIVDNFVVFIVLRADR